MFNVQGMTSQDLVVTGSNEILDRRGISFCLFDCKGDHCHIFDISCSLSPSPLDVSLVVGGHHHLDSHLWLFSDQFSKEALLLQTHLKQEAAAVSHCLVCLPLVKHDVLSVVSRSSSGSSSFFTTTVSERRSSV